MAIALAAHGTVAAAKPPEPLPYPLAPELAVELYLTQTELTPVSGVSSPVVDPVMMNGLVANHGAAGLVGGLLGGLIVGAIIQKGANDGAKWGNQVVGPYDYRTSMEASLRAALVSGGITPSPIVKVVLPEPKPGPGTAVAKPAPASKVPVACTNPVLRLRPLRWAPVNSTLVTGLNASFYDCVPGKKGGLEEKLGWSRGYQVSMVADAEAMPRKQQKGYIEGLDAARVHQLLDHSAAEVAAMFAYEFSQEGRVEREQKVSVWNGFRQIRAGEHWAWNRHRHAMMPDILGTYRLSDASLVAFSAAPAPMVAATALSAPDAAATPAVGEAGAGSGSAVAAPAASVAPAATPAVPAMPAAPATAPATPEAAAPASGGEAVQGG
ncbi:hypothetical protein [Lysobacter sp. 1R34A]|uniref:hypothetical protein n=1 Tax=Lysobacter sp. 1R34A TaxID=3445786 RepID=UPI003EED4651